MMTSACFRNAALTVVLLASGTGTFAAAQNPFFAMDTALRDGKARSAAEQAALLKELGYAGIGTSGYPTEEFLIAFEQVGLKVFNTYLTLSFDSAKPGLDPKLKEFVPKLKGHGTALWVAISSATKDGVKLKLSAAEGDALVLPALHELAALAQASEVKVVFYPHTGFWLERVTDGDRLAKELNHPNVGVTFNLCHWLKVEGDRDPRPVLKAVLPRLFFVSINGADGGDTKAMDWNRLIQPLDAGSYDVAALMKTLGELGCAGPIGFQGYGIKGDARDILRRTMEGWRRINVP